MNITCALQALGLRCMASIGLAASSRSRRSTRRTAEASAGSPMFMSSIGSSSGSPSAYLLSISCSGTCGALGQGSGQGYGCSWLKIRVRTKPRSRCPAGIAIAGQDCRPLLRITSDSWMDGHKQMCSIGFEQSQDHLTDQMLCGRDTAASGPRYANIGSCDVRADQRLRTRSMLSTARRFSAGRRSSGIVTRMAPSAVTIVSGAGITYISVLPPFSAGRGFPAAFAATQLVSLHAPQGRHLAKSGRTAIGYRVQGGAELLYHRCNRKL